MALPNGLPVRMLPLRSAQRNGGGRLALSVHNRCALIWVAAVAPALRLQHNQKGCHAHESEAT